MLTASRKHNAPEYAGARLRRTSCGAHPPSFHAVELVYRQVVHYGGGPLHTKHSTTSEGILSSLTKITEDMRLVDGDGDVPGGDMW